MQRLLESVAHEQHSPSEITLAGLSEPYVTRSLYGAAWVVSFFLLAFIRPFVKRGYPRRTAATVALYRGHRGR